MTLNKTALMMRKIGISILTALIIFSPIAVFGAGLVPCDGINVKCDYQSLIILANNIIDFLLKASVIVAMLLFAYAGFQLIFSGGDTGAMAKAKAVFWSAIKGLVWALAAWLIVDTILKVLLQGDGFRQYVPLGGF